MRFYLLPALALSVAGLPSPPEPVLGDLKPHTLAAFERYARVTEERIAKETSGRAPLLWIDRQPDARKRDHYARLQRGEVVIERLESREDGRSIAVADGMIHHWIGTVLIPGASLDKVVPFVQAYEQYPKHFAPMIQGATIRARDGDRFVVAMRTSMTKVITVTLDADYTIEYRRLNPAKMFTRSITSNIHEVSDPGQPGEQRKPADRGMGYLWRLNTYCSFEARPEGTYEQCESISLTRGLPFVFAMFKPLITSIPRDTLTMTLTRVRAGAGGS
jgi:hypothetical protein